ncbi:MAG TPA: ATP-dependent RNA helicase HrpA [Verrucomicrobiales bacterium]|nr:ATP-dependent RNA helicase HrpA [Verrucomicrobiales bacterium]
MHIDDSTDRLKRLLPDCMLQDRRRLERLLNDSGRSGQLDNHPTTKLRKAIGEAEVSALLRRHREEGLPTVDYPPNLPITDSREEILNTIKHSQVTIVQGETGSGKTTQIPKMCLESGLGIRAKIACTQPRRVAALTISKRIAEELNLTWGKEVGCRIRFDDRTSPQSYIKVLTDGMLLAEIQKDRYLNEYDAIIIDEAHERSLNIDFLLGYLNSLLSKRKDLKLIITSATIDADAFSEAFDGAPIIRVPGKTYPVEVRYEPLNEWLERDEETNHVDAAVQTAQNILEESVQGDILIFMPGERDIRETRDLLLESTDTGNTLILPLFGRLSSGDQQKVFSKASKRKIIIATNVAETSLTIPGIRYVVDTGLARTSRYNPTTHTQRLPIEKISQSSADQRCGRSGRVSDGICIRLYSEEDYLERAEYTMPEIQRANLAEVILKMKAFRLGQIEDFPFIDAPRPKAVRGGYSLLTELGALDQDQHLTEMGRKMAKLPVDPTISRILLQSIAENCLKDVLVIASGLSIQDPRERPMDRKAEADEAQKKFRHPKSDFLSLLNLWNAYQEEWRASKKQGKLRKFCRTNYLSYIRMREWGEIQSQLRDHLKESSKNKKDGSEESPYAAIHRSLLCGFLSNVGNRVEKNLFRLSGDRKAMVFPGSTLFSNTNKNTQKQKPPRKEKPEPDKKSEWVLCGEIVETSRIFARMNSVIESKWVAELGTHLCRKAYRNPVWNRRQGRVLITERTTFKGLEVRNQRVPFSRVDPKAAKEIFIQAALVEADLDSNHNFLKHNETVRSRIETWQTRTRHAGFHDLDDRVLSFYSERLPDISSIHDLNRLVNDQYTKNPEFLFMDEQDLVDVPEEKETAGDFPDQITVDGYKVPIEYIYRPGEAEDGATLSLPFQMISSIDEALLDWCIPGHHKEKIEQLLKSLPKSIRRQLVPINQTAIKIVESMNFAGEAIETVLERVLRTQYGLSVPIDMLREQKKKLPDYLKPRVEIKVRNNETIDVDRNLESLQKRIEKQQTHSANSDLRTKTCQRWEQYDLNDWTFDDLPLKIQIGEAAGMPIFGFPGLRIEEGCVCLRIHNSLKDAEATTPFGFQNLLEKGMAKKLAWLQKDLKDLKKLGPYFLELGTTEQLLESAFIHLKNHLFKSQKILPLERGNYETILKQAEIRLPGLVQKFSRLLKEILELRHELIIGKTGYPEKSMDLNGLFTENFLCHTSFDEFSRFPWYLKAIRIRIERASANPPKDRIREDQLSEFRNAVKRIQSRLPEFTPSMKKRARFFIWMVEEYKISIFAQELKTLHPISAKRLNQFLKENELL